MRGTEAYMQRPPSPSGGEPPSPSILVVDDEKDIRETLKLLFEVQGYTVVGEADSGPEATILAGETQPNFIILDYRMPGMTGEETARILRSISPDSTIVAFSAFLEGEPDWADAFLNKDRINDLPDLVAELHARRPV